MHGETIWVHGSNAQLFTASVGVERTDDDSGLVITAPSIGRANLPDDAYPPVVFAEVRYFLPAPSERGGFSLNAAVYLKYRVDATARMPSGPVAIPDNATSVESRRNVRLLNLAVPLGPESSGIAVRVELSFTLAPPEGPCSHELSARDGYTVNVAGQDGARSSDAGEQSAPRPASEALGDRVTIISARARFTT